MHFRPDFSHGTGHAADQQILLADRLQAAHAERLAAQQQAYEKAQAVSGSVALLGDLIPGQPMGGPEDFTALSGTAADGNPAVYSRP